MKNIKSHYIAWEQAHEKNYEEFWNSFLERISFAIYLAVKISQFAWKILKSIFILLFLSDCRLNRIREDYGNNTF